MRLLFFAMMAGLSIIMLNIFIDNSKDDTLIETPVGVESSINISENLESNIVKKLSTEYILAQHEPESMRELQQQYDDYYTLAIELLHRARAGDGISQLNLAELILYCQQIVLLDIDDLDDRIRILLSSGVSEAEARMLQITQAELARCANFTAVDYKFFEDKNYENDQVLERTLYWVDQAFKNGVTDAAAYLLGLHLGGAISLSVEELSLAADMVSKEFAQPTLAMMRYLSHLSSYPMFYRVVAALEAEQDFYRSSDMLNFNNLNLDVIQCLEQSIIWVNPTFKNYDCAENLKRYGTWLPPELVPEVEAEIEKTKAAWKKGDYAEAGFEALVPLLHGSSNP